MVMHFPAEHAKKISGPEDQVRRNMFRSAFLYRLKADSVQLHCVTHGV